MQKFFSYSPFDHDVEKATSEMNTSEDWETILKICDKVGEKPNGAKDCLRAIVKRLSSNVPHHQMSALTLLDSCIKNCGRVFHLEVCSRDFEVEIKKIVNKAHPKVVEKLKGLMRKWIDDFKNDPELSLMKSLYQTMEKGEKVDGALSSDTISTRIQKKEEPTAALSKEEEDIAKAIELSLKEPSSSPKASSSLYPAEVVSALPKSKESRKVRALYDFEADAYEDELSLKAGETIVLLDDADSNWWKGQNNTGQTGLFPANFVTFDLSCEPEAHTPKEKKTHSVTFNGDVKVIRECEVFINEEKINALLDYLHEADPSGEKADPEELLDLEQHCMKMECLIDEKIQLIDHHNASLTAANKMLVDALHSYEDLMTYGPYSRPEMMHHYQSVVYSGNFMGPSEAYQPVPLPPNTEHYTNSVAPTGPLPTMIPPNMMQTVQSGNPIPYGNTNPTSYSNVSMAPISTPVSSATYGTSHLSSDQNGIFYGNMVMNSVPPNSSTLRQQPML